MLLKLSLLLSTIGIIACNVPFDTTKEVKYQETNQIQQRNYQHSEYLNSYTEVVYKYETNEVNSIDDLIEGNVYQFNCESLAIDDMINQYDFIFVKVLTPLTIYIDDNTVVDTTTDFEDFFGMYVYIRYDSDMRIDIYYSYDQYLDYDYSISYRYEGTFAYDCVVELLAFQCDNHYLFSSTDYNVIETVIYHQPQTVVGVINEFCETYLFSEIPYINSMTFEVGGQNINLMTYLIIIVGICVAIGLLILFFFLMKWLVCFFGGLFKIRR